jgi:hypothetical protein
LNYFYALKCFEEWLATNYLPPISQLIMYKMISLFNSCGWKEWIVADNFYFMSICKVNSEKTFINWRDYLIKEGLIEYSKGAKNKPNKYKLTVNFTDKIAEKTKFTVNFTEKEGEKKELQGERKSNYEGRENGATGTDIPNINLNINSNLNNNSSSISPNGDISGSSSATCKKSTVVKSTKKSKFKELKSKNQFFAMFWDAYPRKECGETAAKAFEKLSPDSALMAEILEGIGRYKKSSQWQDQNFIPFPATFLTQRRWEGEVPEGGQNYAANRDKPRFKATREYPE